MDRETIAAAYRAACHEELRALKPGNVHDFAAGHRMAVSDFETSAVLSAGPLTEPGARVGARVLAAVEATRAAVGQNTNLGILLLCAPLAAAAEAGGDLRGTLTRVLAGLDRADAVDAFAAIRLAAPGGLGTAERHDVVREPQATLLAAMAEAADRDRIACAYVTGFEDLFSTGLPALERARARGLDPAWRPTAVHLAFLAGFPDSHVARRHGPARAEALRLEAARIAGEIDLAARPVEPLLAFDTRLKAEGINPGTSADFTVATLFCARLLAHAA
ncbi:triphosphoribosyl-dephospho-CoA synthase [Salinarimonas soli]|uniref:Triphosphoribosyl-dephospho-CoA synthase n=1 Tax=Salinarimonas soli TaxID=1638099 RepID=A0A5B2VDC1_9HYPH|nr:triphosphoribosyl-dephospho-CoA synthase [Salinarimonas soli]KAA2237503.1 triphosphoribosyl-dephospho-CoA synthase [Salinarimonas soli]